jgi:dethiobiotin synthetase
VQGLLITATDTGVGKTLVSAALLAAMRSEGERVGAYKPVVTGLEDPSEIAARGAWPPDHELLAAAAGMNPEEVTPLRYGPAASPQLAAKLAGERIDPSLLLARARTASEGVDTLIVEGVGGLLTPLAEDYSVCDLAVALGFPAVIAARPGLGTINHTLLTLRVARAAGVDVRAVVLTPWPREPTTLERSNRETIAHLGEVEVEGLGPVASPDPVHLALVGAELCARLMGTRQRPPPARAAATTAAVTVARSSSAMTYGGIV